ncbi:iron ABC transporter permease [Ligilactobacillus murinus]|uniref:FecCD family ABC transporter permease n=1 Tax=Ligilactobacillus murinus TaxID=1622 RepID=UPI002DD66873|nr:iron ABC transporter permease [Ligilactobacillus murinus]WRY37172.1 iron ABC transporter permease [Ligilactobacillus murinus]
MTKKRFFLITGSLFIISVVLSLALGNAKLDLIELWDVMTGQATPAQNFVVFELRMPRVLACLLAGASLGLSGLLLQTLTQNPLADSGTLGINAGAGLLIAFALRYLPQGSYMSQSLPLVSVIGGLLVSWSIYQLAKKQQSTLDPIKFIITGVTLSAILSTSILPVVGHVEQAKLTYMIDWLSGKIMGDNWTSLSLVAPLLLILWGLIYYRSRIFDLLTLAEESSLALGLDLRKARRDLLILTSLLVSLTVIIAGNIVFIGLLAGHMSQLFVPAGHRVRIPATMLLGALILLVADTLTRTFLIGNTLPTGIVVSVIGAPYFLFLMKKAQR